MSNAKLADRISRAPVVTAADVASVERAMDAAVSEALATALDRDTTRALLIGIFAHSPYLSSLIRRSPSAAAVLLEKDPDVAFAELTQALSAEMAATTDVDAAKAQLRRFKASVALLTGLADLGGVWDVMKVVDVLTQTADAALLTSVDVLFRGAVAKGHWSPEGASVAGGAAAHSGYFILAMGKHGAGELNYSSDIDVMVFFDRAKATRDGALMPGQDADTFFVRLTRTLVAMMQDRTPEGYVFRTDLRLRPDPGSTPIAMSTVAALGYYESFGQNWERAAMIKARAVAGDCAAGQAFLDELSPYIWRRSLDFAAIADIHAMKRQIHSFRGFGDIAVPGHNVKLGPGGIREIEFFVQTQQLIAGGRQRCLRGRQTLAMLDMLHEQGWIEADVATDLDAAYRFLRRLEHRIQMVADEQTHTLPTAQADLERIARFSGYATLPAFEADLLGVLNQVQGHYAALFEDSPALTARCESLVLAGSDDDPATLVTLAAMGYARGSEVLAIIRSWHAGRYPAVRSSQARERLTEIQALLVDKLADTADPDQALVSFDRFLSELPSGIQLFSLLSQNPNLLQLIADIMGTAPRLARILSRRRRLLDAVIDPQTFAEIPDRTALIDIITTEVARGTDIQEMLDRARIVGSEQAFLIGVRVLSGAINARQAGDAYAALADAMIAVMMREVETELAHRHGRLPGGACAVVAMGKLGGFEMTAASDLDLIIVYDVTNPSAETDGPKPISAPEYYAKLTKRLITMLTAPTVEGALYEVDLRLRPSGNQGPIATSLRSFVAYQKTSAWTWEQLALTRARVVCGPPELSTKLDAAFKTALSVDRDRAKIAADVRDMRGVLEREKPAAGIWDLKLVRGGLIDQEFIAQHLQLVHGRAYPDVLDTNTTAVFRNLKSVGLLSAADADTLIPASALTHDLMQILRLCISGAFDPEKAPVGLLRLLAAAGGEPTFEALEIQLKQRLSSARDCFDRLVR